MKVSEIEEAVFELDEIRIVIRAPRGADLGEYRYERRAAESASITEWLDQRIRPILNGHGVSVVGGDGNSPHGRVKLSTVRNSYQR